MRLLPTFRKHCRDHLLTEEEGRRGALHIFNPGPPQKWFWLTQAEIINMPASMLTEVYGIPPQDLNVLQNRAVHAMEAAKWWERYQRAEAAKRPL